MAGERLARDDVVVARVVAGLGLGEVVAAVGVAAVEFSAEQVAAAVGIARHVVARSLIGGLRNSSVCCNGGHARGDDGVGAEGVAPVGGRCIFDEELHVAFGNHHIECAAHLIVSNGIGERRRGVVGVVGGAEGEAGAAGRHRGVAAEGQENRPHRARVTVLQAEGSGGLGGAVVFGRSPRRAVVGHLQVLRCCGSGEEHEDGVARLPRLLHGAGLRRNVVVGVQGRQVELDGLRGLRRRGLRVLGHVVVVVAASGERQEGAEQ